MSHPPETDRPYNDFLEIFNDYKKLDRKLFGETHGFDIADAIEAWVRVREAEARLDESTIWRSIVITSSNFPEQASRELKTRVHQLEFALATARKQLREQVK